MNKWIIILGLVFSSSVFADSVKPPHVLAQLPSHEIKLGELVEIPINILSEDMEIVSYAVELKYDTTLVKFMEVRPGLTPWYNDQPMHNADGSASILITGSANAFGTHQKIVNVANVRFELIGENSLPMFELIQTGPTVRKEGFAAVRARHTVEGEMDLYNFLFDSGFE